MLLLQDKLNTYLEFILGGQLHTNFPRLRDKPIVINLVGAYLLSEEAKKFFNLATGLVEESGLQLRFKLLPMDDSFGRAVVPDLESD